MKWYGILVGDLEKWSLFVCCGEVVEEGEKAVEIDVLFYETTSVAPVLDITLLIDWTDVAEDIFIVVTRISTLTVGNYSMHPELGVFTFFD